MVTSYKFELSVKVIREPEYSFYIRSVIDEFKDSFDDLESLEVHFSENVIIGNGMRKSTSINFSEDQSQCVINLPINLYFNKKNEISKPLPADVFQELRNAINEAKKLYEGTNET